MNIKIPNLPILTQCCCGCSVRVGSLIIGYVELFLSALGVMWFSMAIDYGTYGELSPSRLSFGQMVYGLVFSIIGGIMA